MESIATGTIRVKMTDWTKRKPQECIGCPAYEFPGPVWGTISTLNTAKIIYIGQNPGKEEVKKGEPFVGSAGRVFNRQLVETKIKRSEMYITNQMKCQTPSNRVPTKEEIEHCSVHLKRELERCKADVVMLAGDVAFQSNVGSYSSLMTKYKANSSIMARMGCVEHRDGRKWIGTIHPAFVLRTPTFRSVAPEHLRKAWRIAGSNIPTPEIEIFPPDEKVIEYVESCEGEFSDDVEVVGMENVEEDDYVGSNQLVTMCGVSCRPWHSIIVRRNQIKLLDPLFRRGYIHYEHNGQFDQYHIRKYIKGEWDTRDWDTMSCHHWLRSNVHKYLKPHVLSIYTNLPYYDRALGKVNEPFYCGMDAITTFLAGREMRKQMGEI